MNRLNYEFFEEFKKLDSLCKDLCDPDGENKTNGVTLYLEEMNKKSYQSSSIAGWTSDYNKLKTVRNLRNELAHSSNSFSYRLCTQEHIDFVYSFKTRILNQTDPLALLRKQGKQPQKTSFEEKVQPKKPQQTTYNDDKTDNDFIGCIGVVAICFIFAILICTIMFFL